MATITWNKTNFLGVRYREHSSRKHGGNRPDKCFYIHYKVDGKTRDEAVGWSSEGVTAEKAFKILAQLREANRLGKGPKTLSELRSFNEQDELQRQQEAVKASEYVTFSGFWESNYFPNAELSKKQTTIASERWLYGKWIEPEIGKLPLKGLTVSHIENLVMKAQKAKKSAATIRYILAIISQVWSKADVLGIVSGDCPCRKVKKPRQDNRRIRFLEQEEADLLLETLRLHSIDMHDIALLSLYTGMRAGEIHSLTWGNINFSNLSIEIMDPKSKRNRIAFMTPEIEAMLKKRFEHQTRQQLVFPGKNGRQRKDVSDTFNRVVNELGLNDSGEIALDEAGEEVPVRISDTRQKIVFHTLRHTFASWLVQKGVPLYTVAELMGHSTIEMTKRYSHLAPDSLRSAAMTLSPSQRQSFDTGLERTQKDDPSKRLK